jgi:predicted RNA-binding protein YlqC (UPF0109 family)
MMNDATAQPTPSAETPPQRRGDLKLLIEEVVKMFVSHPDEVEVETEQDRGELVLNLYVAPDDLGKVIGKQGRMARSLRTLLDAAALRQNKRASLEIVETDEEEPAEGPA